MPGDLQRIVVVACKAANMDRVAECEARNGEALQKLIEEHGGTVPRSREALESLPGVGRKTANVVLNVAFSESTIAIDTHIFRVSNRTGLARGKTPLKVEEVLNRVVPDAAGFGNFANS